jgi:hypothetical protein
LVHFQAPHDPPYDATPDPTSGWINACHVARRPPPEHTLIQSEAWGGVVGESVGGGRGGPGNVPRMGPFTPTLRLFVGGQATDQLASGLVPRPELLPGFHRPIAPHHSPKPAPNQHQTTPNQPPTILNHPQTIPQFPNHFKSTPTPSPRHLKTGSPSQTRLPGYMV